MTDHANIVRDDFLFPVTNGVCLWCGEGITNNVHITGNRTPCSWILNLVAERDEAQRELRERDGTVERWQHAAEAAERAWTSAEADRDTLAAALLEIVMAEPDDPQPGSATAWPSFAGRLQNIAGAALAANTTAKEPA